MRLNECIPYKEPGAHITGTATAAVTGKRAVAISGDLQADGTASIAPPAAGGRILGVAAWDAAIGAQVTVIRTPGIILPMTSGAAIAAGAQVQVDATGRVVPLAAGVAIGTAVTGVGAADNDAMISLFT